MSHVTSGIDINIHVRVNEVGRCTYADDDTTLLERREEDRGADVDVTSEDVTIVFLRVEVDRRLIVLGVGSVGDGGVSFVGEDDVDVADV